MCTINQSDAGKCEISLLLFCPSVFFCADHRVLLHSESDTNQSAPPSFASFPRRCAQNERTCPSSRTLGRPSERLNTSERSVFDIKHCVNGAHLAFRRCRLLSAEAMVSHQHHQYKQSGPAADAPRRGNRVRTRKTLVRLSDAGLIPRTSRSAWSGRRCRPGWEQRSRVAPQASPSATANIKGSTLAFLATAHLRDETSTSAAASYLQTVGRIYSTHFDRHFFVFKFLLLTPVICNVHR